MKRLSLRSILLFISVLFLLMPLGSIYFLHIYESALIRQTESELISQAAFVAALYKYDVAQMLSKQHINIHAYGIPSPLAVKDNHSIYPIPAHLDLAKDKLFPPRPLPRVTNDQLDMITKHVGEELLPVLQDAQRITLSGIKVLDYQGIVVAGKDEYGLSFTHTEEFQQAKTGQSVHLLRIRRMPASTAPLSSTSRNSNINVFVALPIILEDRLIGVVWLNRTPTDITQALYNKRREILWTTFWIVLFTGLITAITSYAITRPIQLLAHKTELVIQGDPKGLEPIKNPVTAEVAQLSKSLTQMAQTLQYRADYIQNFAQHVSHEFKTPLTSIQGSVELLQDDLNTMPAEQQQRFLNNIHQDVERLTLLVSRLMELAKADMTETFTEPLPLQPIIERITQQYSSNHFHVNLYIPEESHSLFVQASEEVLHGIVAHILENSVQANATESQITISTNSNMVIIRIQDNGPGISPQNRSEIFTPFFTTKRTSGGTGLGLSITKALIDRLGGTIQMIESPLGACFEVYIPKVEPA